MIGKTIAHYEITSLLGKGGMGEVYQAKDTKLGRDVAIKVLPDEFASDADRVARFQREAKLLASLNHPNIASIHGLEESENIHFLVMELVEGNTLADLIKTGPIPVEEALKLALQIAEALEAAHEKGVIHRDLKPANIKVTPEGKVKILDFGLAKAFAEDHGEEKPMDSPTLSAEATRQGIILGTAAYMSPEQARGKPVDKRVDIWAFGCVLYEILTGQAAFQGEDVTEILASVVKSEVNFDLLPVNIHLRIREVLTRCLQKEQKKRYPEIGEAQYEIEQVLTDPSGIFAQPDSLAKPRKKFRLVLPWLTAAVTLTAIIAGIGGWILKPTTPPEPKPVMYFDYDLPQGQKFTGGAYKSVAVSADGKMIIYVANNQLYLKKSNEFDAEPVRGTNGNPVGPIFSPDGQWIAFFSETDRKLKKISIMGGTPMSLCENTNVLGAVWGADNRIVFSNGMSIMQISAYGGSPEEIIIAKDSDELLLFPQFLPDGKSVLFSVYDNGGFHACVQSLISGERKDLFAGFPAQYLPSGHIVYGLKNTLIAVNFDPKALEMIGSPVPLVENVFRLNSIYTTNAVISDSGTLVYIPGRTGGASTGTLVWVNREGHEEPLGETADIYNQLKISPDGRQVALSITVNGNEDIYIYDLSRGTKTRLTLDDADDYCPVWTPDGKWIIFCSARAGKSSIFRKSADGMGKAEQLASWPGGWMFPYSLSNNGSMLFFVQVGTDASKYNIGILSMTGDDRTPKLLLHEEYDEEIPMISPDGRWLAYASNESGRWEIFIRSFPDIDSGEKRQVSTGGGEFPSWSPDGRELFYQSGDTTMVVSVETAPILSLGTPQKLFSGPYLGGDISPDGKRFLMIKPGTSSENESLSTGSRKINIVLNWFEELKEKVPVK